MIKCSMQMITQTMLQLSNRMDGTIFVDYLMQHVTKIAYNTQSRMDACFITFSYEHPLSLTEYMGKDLLHIP